MILIYVAKISWNKIQMLKVFNFTKVSYNCYRFDIYFKILALDRKYSSG